MRRAVLLFVLLLAGCASTSPRSPIDSLLGTPPLDRALWGIDVEDDDGTIVYQHNAHRLFIPASNRKLFAAATVVACEGFDHQRMTELWLDGEDAVLRGGGDPSFGGRYYPAADAAFAPFVDALRARGITRVRNVIADVSAFDRTTIPGSWKYGNLGQNYAAPVDALAYAENAIGEASVPDPAVFAATSFRDALILGGIGVSGIVLRVDVVPRPWAERVAVVASPPVSQLLTTVLKNSQNLYTEMLFKGLAGTYDGAERLERQFLIDEVGIDGGEFRFVDGSGLAPDDLVTPAAIVKMLRWIDARPAFWPLMATPGDEGTLHWRLTELRSRMRGKTGTINGVNALSGILAMPNGRRRYFSIVINHHLAVGNEATATIDGIVREIAK